MAADDWKVRHPLYSEFLPDWQLMRDSYEGERAVKQRGSLYLPATSGMIEDGFANPQTLGGKLITLIVCEPISPIR